MTERITLSWLAVKVRSVASYCTLRKQDNNHLVPQAEKLDVLFGETHTNVPIWHPVGFTSVALPQDEEEQQQGAGGSSGGGSGGGGFGGLFSIMDNKQPQGKSAQGVTIYPNADRSTALALIHDPRVTPYSDAEKSKTLTKGSTYLYAADGHGSGALINNNGTWIHTTDSKGHGKDAKEAKRRVGIGHVKKEAQSREIGDSSSGSGSSQSGSSGGQDDYDHEGNIHLATSFTEKKMTTEKGDGKSKTTKSIIEYDKDADKLTHNNMKDFQADFANSMANNTKSHTINGQTIAHKASSTHDLNGKTLNLNGPGKAGMRILPVKV